MEYELRIEEIHCTSCARSIEQYLDSESGVTDVTVSYDAQRGTVSMSPDADIDHIVDAIERMGYDATVLTSE
jgi:copper chaperone CopZ